MFSTQFVISFSLLLSLPLLFLLAPRILTPKQVSISLPDELDDLALFRRATLPSLHHHRRRQHRRRPDSISRPGTANPDPRIAFLFLTNTDLHFAQLWQQFFQGNENRYNIYVHADPTARLKSPGGVFDGRFIAGRRTERGSPTLISAARRLLATAILDDVSNTYFALISQNCIPIHSFEFTYKSIFNSAESARTRNPTRPTHRSFIEILSDEPQLPERYLARGDDVMLPEVPFEKFRVGSQFFVLTRKHAVRVIKDTKLWRKFKLPCLNTDSCYPEEHYFPTLLSMEDPDGCTHYTLTRVNWTGSTGGHPHTYQPLEVSPGLISELRRSNSTYDYLFARKFSPDCLQPLLDIAKKAIFKD